MKCCCPASAVSWLTPLVALLLAIASPARAEDVSLLHKDRIAFGVGADYQWWTSDPAPALEHEFALSGHAVYVLTTHLAVKGAATFGLANRVTIGGPELRWRMNIAEADVSLGVGYDFYGGPDPERPEYAHEWAVAAYYARPLIRGATVGVGVRLGLDNKLYRTAIGIRVPILSGRDSQ